MFFLHLGDFVPNELHAYRTTKKTLYIVPDPLAIELKKIGNNNNISYKN